LPQSSRSASSENSEQSAFTQAGVLHFAFYHHEPFPPFSLEQLHAGDARYGGSVARLRLLFSLADRGHRVTLVGNVQEGEWKGVQALKGDPGLAEVLSAPAAGTALILNNLPPAVRWGQILRLKSPSNRVIAWVGNHLNSRWLRSLACGELDRAVCVSRWHREQYRVYPGFERIEASYSGVDTDLMRGGTPTVFREPTALFTSVPRRSKGFHHVLRAWSRVRRVCPTARLRVCGSVSMHVPNGVGGKTGVLDPDLEAEFPEWFGDPPGSHQSVGIDLMGARSLGDVYRDLRGATIAVVNCNWRGSTETYCRAAVEAQVAGIPVVGAAAGSLTEVVANGKTGLLVDRPDSAKLADAMVTLLQDDNLRRQMASAGPAWARPLAEYELIAGDWEAIVRRSWRGEPAAVSPSSFHDFLRRVGYGRARTWMRERLRETQFLEQDRAP